MPDIDYQSLELPYLPHNPALNGKTAFIVVGAGPVGLTMALDLAGRGNRVVVLDDSNRLSKGSRAICFSKRALDIWDRLGVGERMVSKGVSWNVGKVFFRDEEVWRFDLLPESGHRRPAFINLQQYYCEGYLYEAAAQHPNIELRWLHKAVALTQYDDYASLQVHTPDGDYTMDADWIIACDGSRSTLRQLLGQESHGRVFQDRFLIADVRMAADYPSERWFWFDPPFHRNQSVLLHSQPDNVWRIDFQLGWDADPVEEVKPENVIPRIRALLGNDTQFDLEWVSIYTFCCERMDRFRHGRVLFAGDSAYRVSPFGARGANSGLQDVDNLAWKLDLVARGTAPEALLESYCEERGIAADENLLNSTRSTDFITPKSEISLLFRNMTLTLAKEHAFARALVNSGRLSLPTHYTSSSLNTQDCDVFQAAPPLGATAPDGPVMVWNPAQNQLQPGWWLSQLQGQFAIAVFCDGNLSAARASSALAALQDHQPQVRVILVLPSAWSDRMPAGQACAVDADDVLARRYDATQGACYLIRPDQHIAARWRSVDADAIRDALSRAMALQPSMAK